MTDYYRVDHRRVTLREYWNIGRTWKVIIPWVSARLGAPMPSEAAFPKPPPVVEMEVTEAEFLPAAKAKLQPMLDQLLRLGFHTPRYYSYCSLKKDLQTSFISLLHGSGEMTVRLMHTLASTVTPPMEKTLVALLSEMNDGTFLCTSDQGPTFNVAPGVRVVRQVGGTPAQLVELHQKSMAQYAVRNPPKPVLTVQAFDALSDRYERLCHDFQVSRGVYVRMTTEEADVEHKDHAEVQAMTAGGVAHAEVLAELVKLQNKKGGWGNAILIFIVSLVLFAGAGARSWSWDYVIILIPVLFVHELGHYLAMRAFHYRNLRMFFIPFFGAAVSGQHYNVPGWKKVVVSLMGPVPGIVLGSILGFVGLYLHHALMVKVALVTLVLNGFNLLPILPLDGGWVFHTLIFSRHYIMDVGFRVLAAIALIVGGSYSGDGVLRFLGIFMLFGVPMSYRMAKITQTLRERGISPASTDEQTVPTDTAVAIIDELKKTLPGVQTNKTLAQHTLSTFESMNGKPPGWPATFGLLLVYALSIGLALVFASLCFVGKHGRLGDLSELATESKPVHPIEPGSMVSWQGTEAASAARTNTVTVIATFKSPALATQAFSGLTNRLPPSAGLNTFGESLFLELPSGAAEPTKSWISELKGQTTNCLVHGTNTFTVFTLSVEMPTEQQAIDLERELEEYFSADLTHTLIPPWQAADGRSPEQRAAHQFARKTFLKSQSERGKIYSDPKMKALQKRIGDAYKKKDKALMADLGKQMTVLSSELARERLEELKKGGAGEFDNSVIDLFIKWSAASEDDKSKAKTLSEISMKMGELPVVNGKADHLESRFAAKSGDVSQEKQQVELSWLSFVRIREGAPGLVGWLLTKGGTQVRYSITSGSGSEPDAE